MLTRTLREFRFQVSPDVPGCPGAMIDRAVRQAAIEFCRFTRTWREALDPFRARDGVAEYELDLPACALIESVVFAQHNGVEILPTTEQTLVDTGDTWRTQEATQVTNYYLKDRNLLRVYPIPDTTTAKALDVVVALKPAQDATELPEILFNDHLEALGHGALQRLKAMPRKSWSAPEDVQYHMAQFERMKKDEKAERLNDYTRESTLRVRPASYW